MSVSFDTFDEAYNWLYAYVQKNGFWCEPRGQPCQEVRPCSFYITNPDKALYRGAERRLNYRFFAVETMAYIAGEGDEQVAQLITAVNRNMIRFINPKTKTFDGIYGPRLKHGLANVYNSLKKDVWTRQAVASVWHNTENMDTVDVPCTLSLNFFCTPKSEEEPTPRLNMQATMRSNDLNWGTPYDVAAFCEILCVMASVLDIEVGTYYHNVGSLHYYRDSPPVVEKTPIRPVTDDDVPLTYISTRYETWDEVVKAASWFIRNARQRYFYNYNVFNVDEKDDPWLARMVNLCHFTWQFYGSAK